jgi:hypothetical protein
MMMMGLGKHGSLVIDCSVRLWHPFTTIHQKLSMTPYFQDKSIFKYKERNTRLEQKQGLAQISLLLASYATLEESKTFEILENEVSKRFPRNKFS